MQLWARWHARQPQGGPGPLIAAGLLRAVERGAPVRHERAGDHQQRGRRQEHLRLALRRAWRARAPIRRACRRAHEAGRAGSPLALRADPGRPAPQPPLAAAAARRRGAARVPSSSKGSAGQRGRCAHAALRAVRLRRYTSGAGCGRPGRTGRQRRSQGGRVQAQLVQVPGLPPAPRPPVRRTRAARLRLGARRLLRLQACLRAHGARPGSPAPTAPPQAAHRPAPTQ